MLGINEFAEMSLVEFGIGKQQSIVYKLIQELILTQQDLDELREGMSRPKHSNKLHKILCAMRKRRLNLK